MATTTTSLELVKPELQDTFNLKHHLNDNLDKIDTAYKEVEDINERFVMGKNLFNKNAIQEYKSITSTGVIIDTNTEGSNCFDLSDWIPIKAGETMYFSNNGTAFAPLIAVFDRNKNFIQRYDFTTSEITAEVDGYVIFRLNHPSSIINTIQVEIGDGVTAYERFQYDLKYKSYGDFKISITERGAVGDGKTDSTKAIQNCINEIAEATENEYFGRNPVVVFPAGTYIVSNTIEVPVTVTIEVVGMVRILSDMDDRAVIHINTNGTHTEAYSTSNAWEMQDNMMCKKVIIGGGTLVLSKITKANYTANNNSIGISIGNPVHDKTLLRCAGFDFNNTCILGFNTAMRIFPKDVYIVTINKLSVSHNYIGVKWGENNGEYSVNAGERINFNNCTFSGCATAIVVNTSLTSMGFNNCSFDFNVNQVSIYTKMALMLSFNQCHIEGTGRNDVGVSSDYDGYGQIIFKGSEGTKNVLVTFVDTFFVKNIEYIATTQFSSTVADTLHIKLFGCYVYDNSTEDMGTLEAGEGVALTVF